MYLKLIENYIKNLTLNDITIFALKNNIELNNQELDFIYKTLKNDYQLLLSEDYLKVFSNGKNYLSPTNYEKILNLYLEYRLKYL